jgi:hypothetical protein
MYAGNKVKAGSVDAKGRLTFEAVRIEQRNLPQSEFRPPPGFTKAKVGVLGPMGGAAPPGTGR